MANKDFLTVEQFNTYVRNIFNEEELLHNVPIVGEVGGCSVVGGHCYFTLKDKNAQLSVVCFDCKRTYVPKNGEQVLVTGRPDFYVKNGKLSLSAYRIELYGAGLLFQKLEELKQRLKDEGLFDAAHKKKVPLYPNNIAIITSAKGAAIQDIITTVYKYNTKQKLTVVDVRVQGEHAAREITKALTNADKLAFDVIIIARGGGSFEDLLPFNDEALARAVYAAHTPVISAVGHETDYSLCDFVADERAITPTAAAERVGYDIELLKDSVSGVNQQLFTFLKDKLDGERSRVINIITDIGYRWRQLLTQQNYQLDVLKGGIKLRIERKINKYEADAARLLNALDTLNPSKLLQKGYFRVTKLGSSVSGVAELQKDDIIDIYAYDGATRAIITDKAEHSL
ncbi:MAG: exodeoxyribonuclease VII large subunit [Clostridia bacterium]|nr:exodeoxyribonuclease VII large subunit [Clostridia bacterium]